MRARLCPRISPALTSVQDGAEGQAAGLGVEWEGVWLQLACGHHLHGFLVPDHPACIHVDVGHIERLADIHTKCNRTGGCVRQVGKTPGRLLAGTRACSC